MAGITLEYLLKSSTDLVTISFILQRSRIFQWVVVSSWLAAALRHLCDLVVDQREMVREPHAGYNL